MEVKSARPSLSHPATPGREAHEVGGLVFDAQALALQGRARQFAVQVLMPLEQEAERRGGRLSQEAIGTIKRQAIDAGLAGGLHAREHGGHGWTRVEWALVEEQYGRTTNAIHWHVPNAYNVWAHASDAHVDRDLRPALRGELKDAFTQYGPPDEEGWPEGAHERYADACIEQLGQFAPNLPGAVLEREVLAPPDLERIFGLEGGSIFQGEQGLDQMAFMRPHPELAQYATPVHGLYLCGAGTHPGGGVTGCSGHNAAQRILKDRRRARRPWCRRAGAA
jgi:phytoene dehydrogenase-like protein